MGNTLYRGWLRPIKPLGALLLAAGVLASCASLVGPRQIEVPLTKLQAGIERRFPLDQRVLQLLDIRLSHPQLTIEADTERIALSMDAELAPPFVKQSWRGSMSVSGRLRIDAARGAIVMLEPRIDRFVIDSADEARQRQFTKVANLLADRLIRDVPVYSFRMDELRYAGVQFVPTRIAALPGGLSVTLEPVR
jgi:hypothetical protein